MENLILVKTTFTTRTYLPAAPSDSQIELAVDTMGILTGLETRGTEQIAWVLWEPENYRQPRPVLAGFIEAVGIRLGSHSVMVE